MTMTGRVRTVVLVGLMGSGKTTVARLVGEACGRRVLDTDTMVEDAAGLPVREVILRHGEADFRRREAAALAEALEADDVVVAAAGGAVCTPESAELVRHRRDAGTCTVVWLTAPVEELARRTAGGAHRPALDEEPVGSLARMEAERRETYASLADVVVPTDDADPVGVATRVLAIPGVGEASDGK